MWWCYPLCNRHNVLSWFFAVLSQYSTGSIPLHSDKLSWFRAIRSVLFLLNDLCLAEKQQIPMVYSLVWFVLPRSSIHQANMITITPPLWSSIHQANMITITPPLWSSIHQANMITITPPLWSSIHQANMITITPPLWSSIHQENMITITPPLWSSIHQANMITITPPLWSSIKDNVIYTRRRKHLDVH